MRRTNHRNLVNVGILSGRIPLISLVQFIAVAEHLNFRHAAKALGISQCPSLPLYCKQDIFIFYIQWLIFLLIGNTMKNTMLRKGLTIF